MKLENSNIIMDTELQCKVFYLRYKSMKKLFPFNYKYTNLKHLDVIEHLDNKCFLDGCTLVEL